METMMILASFAILLIALVLLFKKKLEEVSQKSYAEGYKTGWRDRSK